MNTQRPTSNIQRPSPNLAFLLIGALFAQVSNASLFQSYTTATAPASSIILYISSSGSDSNPGTDPLHPIQSYTRLIELLSAGETVLFSNTSNYGDGTNGTFSIPDTAGGNSGEAMFNFAGLDNLTIGTYGPGPGPIIDCASYLPSTGWTQYGSTNIYYRSLTLGHGNQIGFQGQPVLSGSNAEEQPSCWDLSETGANLQRMRVFGLNGTQAGGTGNYSTLSAALTAMNFLPWSFLYDPSGNNLYVITYSSSAPTANEIAVSVKDSAFSLGNNTVLNGPFLLEHALYNSGPVYSLAGGGLANCTILGGPIHLFVGCPNFLTNVTFRDLGCIGDYSPDSVWSWFLANTGGISGINLTMDGVNFIGRLCVDGVSIAPSPGGQEGFMANHHTGSLNPFGTLTMKNCVLQNCSLPSLGTASPIDVSGNKFYDDSGFMIAGFSGVLNSSNNAVVNTGTKDTSGAALTTYQELYELNDAGDVLNSTSDIFSCPVGPFGLVYNRSVSTINLNHDNFNLLSGSIGYGLVVARGSTVSANSNIVTGPSSDYFIGGSLPGITYSAANNVYSSALELFNSGSAQTLQQVQAAYGTETNSINSFSAMVANPMALFSHQTSNASFTNLSTTLTAMTPGRAPATIQLPTPGTYRITGGETYWTYGSAVWRGNLTTSIVAYRTNNKPGALTNGTFTVYYPNPNNIPANVGQQFTIPPFNYTTANSTDIIQIWSKFDHAATSGGITCEDAWIKAELLPSSISQ